jgi:hypothetical protein
MLFRLESDGSIDGVPGSPLAPDVAFGSLHAYVAEKKLDLVQFAAGIVT